MTVRATVSARCDALVLTETLATGRVEASYELITRVGATVAPAVGSPDTVRSNRAAAAAHALPPGGSLRVTVSATRSLATTTRCRGGPWVISPAVVRHPFLGESADLGRQGDAASVCLYLGERVTLEGAITLDTDSDPAVHVVADSRQVTLSVAAREDVTGPLCNGGPVFAFGLRGPIDQPLSRGVYRVGWEVSLFEYGFVQAAMEMDGESLFESLAVDVATPEIAVMIPSLRLGVGLVARQLGPRPADFALRLRVGASMLPAGFDADFDDWPAVSGWTLSFTGRISP